MAPEERDRDVSSDGDEESLSPREFVIQLARDLIVAVVIIGIAIGSVFLYTGVWPPMVVVESGSMQHSGTRSSLGVIDTGDLVLVQTVAADPRNVVPYVEGRISGYETYSNYGDVIVFHPPWEPAGGTPIIHRAIVYVEYPSGAGPGLADIPSLAAPFPRAEWSGTDGSGNNATSPLGLRTATIQVQSFDTGTPRTVLLRLNFSTVTTSGFVTKGDNNRYAEQSSDSSRRPVVPASAIVGKARGELPWFGLVKLTIWPTSSGCCKRGWGDVAAPRNSWDSLATSLVLIPLGIFLADYGFAFGERFWKGLRGRMKARAGHEEASPEDDGAESNDNPR